MAAAALLGLFASSYLLYTYVSGAPIVCGLHSGCETVRASVWAKQFGLPRPLFGVLFYTFFYGLLVARAATAAHKKRLLQLTQLTAILGFAESVELFFIQWLSIKAFCLWCLTSLAATLIIFSCVWMDRADESKETPAQAELQRLFMLLCGFAVLAGIGFWILLRIH